MCIHPEAIEQVKNFIANCGNKYHTVYDENMDTSNYAQWVAGYTNHPSNSYEKFELKTETEQI